MPPPVAASTLCSACQVVFRERDERDGAIVHNSHHSEIESFLAAVQAECYICSTIWRNISERCQNAWLNRDQLAFWFGLIYWTEEDRSLRVTYFDPVDSQTLGVTFVIVPLGEIELSDKFSVKEISPDTSSSSTLGLAYQWYTSCRACHKLCSQFVRRPRWYPTRLLDIGVQGDLKWKLRVLSERGPMSPNYMTLSYRWGASSSLTLTHSNYEDLQCGRPICDLPLTFRDAVLVARRFSIRYLWIDCLCIIQDSEKDWQKESSMMRDVYANSSCNISATASVDPDGGLFRPRRREDIQPGVLKSSNPKGTEELFFVCDRSYWNRQVFNMPLHQRGWVFQESLLSPRVLHFAGKQIFWECFTQQKCEAFPSGLPWQVALKDLGILSAQTPSYIFNKWNEIIQAYSSCGLTRSSDKLVALSGLARLFQDITGDEYLAGLWKSHVVEYLGWRVDKPVDTLPEYRAPSWSWASLDSQVQTSHRRPGVAELVGIKETGVLLSTPDATGQVRSGFITVEGLLLLATRLPDLNGPLRFLIPVAKDGTKWFEGEADDVDVWSKVRGSAALQNELSISTYVWMDAKGTDFNIGKDLCCLALTCSLDAPDESEDKFFLTGLLLKPLQAPSNEYARIGYFTAEGKDNIQKFGISVDEREGSVVAEIRPDQLSTIKII